MFNQDKIFYEDVEKAIKEASVTTVAIPLSDYEELLRDRFRKEAYLAMLKNRFLTNDDKVIIEAISGKELD